MDGNEEKKPEPQKVGMERIEAPEVVPRNKELIAVQLSIPWTTT